MKSSKKIGEVKMTNLTGSVKEPVLHNLHDIVQDIPNKISWLSKKLAATGKKATAAGKNVRKKMGKYLKELGVYLESLDKER
jgi:hypothetical protein